MTTDYVTREEFDELLARVLKLENSKATPKKKTAVKLEPLILLDFITKCEKGEYSCAHCFKVGINKDKFCSSASKLHFNGQLIAGEITIDKEDFYKLRCSSHIKGSNNKSIDYGKKLIETHYGTSNDDTAIARNEDDPSQQVAALLSGNPVDVPTTPSKSKKKESKEVYLEQGEFMDQKIDIGEEKSAYIRYRKGKNGTPLKKPSPYALGVCSNDIEDYLNNLEVPDDSVLARLGVKYKGSSEKKPEAKKDIDEDDVSSGLTEVKQPSVITPEETEDPYEVKTESEDDDEINDLLEDLK